MLQVLLTHLSLVPEFGRVGLGTTLAIRLHHLKEELFIEFDVYVPVLHTVGDIRRLDHVLQNNGGFAVDILVGILLRQSRFFFFCERKFPPFLTELLQTLV